jgi:hypothetical protein
MGKVPVPTAGEIVKEEAFVTFHDKVAGWPAMMLAGCTPKAITACDAPVLLLPPPLPGPEAPTPPQPQRLTKLIRIETRDIFTNRWGIVRVMALSHQPGLQAVMYQQQLRLLSC